MANSVNPDQTAPIGAVCSVSTLFPSIPYWSVMLDNYLQQTPSAEDIFRYIYFLRSLAPLDSKACKSDLRHMQGVSKSH